MSPTLLIVDDERHTREGLRTALEDRYDVYVAADIPGALSVLENDTIDLMVTDLRLGARGWDDSSSTAPCACRTRPSAS